MGNSQTKNQEREVPIPPDPPCPPGHFILTEALYETEMGPSRYTKHVVPGTPEDNVLFVKMLTGKLMVLPYDKKKTILDIKEEIFTKQGIPTDSQRLINCGSQLQDDRTLEDYCIYRCGICHLVLRLRGAPPISENCTPSSNSTELYL
jgi:ubiquitin